MRKKPLKRGKRRHRGSVIRKPSSNPVQPPQNRYQRLKMHRENEQRLAEARRRLLDTHFEPIGYLGDHKKLREKARITGAFPSPAKGVDLQSTVARLSASSSSQAVSHPTSSKISGDFEHRPRVLRRSSAIEASAKKLARPKTRMRTQKRRVGGRAKTSLEWTIYHARQVPGVGAYSLPSLSKPPGGIINEAKPKTELEILEHRQKGLPGPGKYTLPEARMPGGRFNESKTKSDLEWTLMRAADLPAPGENQPVCGFSSLQCSGGKFNDAKPKTELELIELHGADLPGPAHYNTRLPTRIEGGKILGGPHRGAPSPESDLE